MIKAIKVLNVISVLLFAAVLLLVYAYLPIQVDLNIEDIRTLHKQTFFYYAFGGFIVINIVLRLIANLGTKGLNDITSSWIKTIIFIVNFYLTTMVGFIGVMNNSTHISPNSYAYLTYLGPTFLVIWLVGLVFLFIRNK